ncbi:MAG TPA: WYL domain-containing protein [Acidimicrobiales bacterium]|nr:WYL domain-containing protein [Acidimicrobiales bacterium]
MRADRLVSLLLLLQQRQRVTAAEVAEELEVSERTARRDLEALSVAGLPVYAERGRGGGWRLLGGGRTDLSGLSADEARALFLVAGPAPATPELKAALRKLVRALPEPLRQRAEASASSVIVDPGGWGQVRRHTRPVHLDALQAAAADGVQVRLGYTDRGGKPSVRVVHPLGVAMKGTVWYLVAGTDDGLRTFRVNRVRSVEPTGDPVVRPDGFDLADTWRHVVDTVDRLRSPAAVSGLAEPELVEALRWMFERQVDVGAPGADGRVPVTVRGQRVERLAAQLAGFGRRLEITDPPEARHHLLRLGEELTAVYGGPGDRLPPSRSTQGRSRAHRSDRQRTG